MPQPHGTWEHWREGSGLGPNAPWRRVPRPVHVRLIWYVLLMGAPIAGMLAYVADGLWGPGWLFDSKWLKAMWPWSVLAPLYSVLIYQQFRALKWLKRASANGWQLCTECGYPLPQRRGLCTCSECGHEQNARHSRARWRYAREMFPLIKRYVPMPHK